jgi:hypothetical protein
MPRLFKPLVAISIGLIGLATIWGCETKKTGLDNSANPSATEKSVSKVAVPAFDADSAYQQVAAQVAFGPRVPNSKAHQLCGDYLVQELKSAGWQVTEQPFETTAFTGAKLKCRNIIASYKPEATTRILLASHWDTRPFADQDIKDQDKPIDGANDGASGVGILVQLAKTVQKASTKPNVGIDIIFFDAEDYGDTDAYKAPEGEEPGKWWCLGSKYWAQNKHKEGYSAYFGILLDMVGAPNAKFHQEGASLQFAPTVVEKVWNAGKQAGYGNYFVMSPVDGITDDHVYVNQIAKINMIDIIEYDPTDGQFFSNTWHRHSDNMSNIDRKTLQAVGHTLLHVVYQEQP